MSKRFTLCLCLLLAYHVLLAYAAGQTLAPAVPVLFNNNNTTAPSNENANPSRGTTTATNASTRGPSSSQPSTANPTTVDSPSTQPSTTNLTTLGPEKNTFLTTTGQPKPSTTGAVASSSVTTVNGKQTVTGSPQEDTETPYSTTPFTDAPTTTPEPKPDPCLEDPYPCDNGGWCMPLARNASFGCICKGEWTGRTCDKKKDCDCNNGGACVSFQGQSGCMCPHQWKGEICTLKRSICEMYEPCNNSAICSGDHLLYSCSCTEQWTGTNCSEPKVCYPSRCSGHGLCEEILNGTDWFCNCFRGWRGDTCNQQSECDLKCRHGECVNGTETCVCKTGFKGKFCDLGISANTRPTARAPMGPWYSYPAYVALAGVGVIIVIMLFTICVMAWYLRISTSDKPDFHRTAKNDREKIINNRHDKPRKQIGFAFDHENKMDDEAIMY